MFYQNVVKGSFLSRPNRFIAQVQVGESTETVHVKNTGRCRELLVPGATVYLCGSRSPHRKTAFDLIAVEKGDILINIDSQAPNRAVQEWLEQGGFIPGLTFVRPEAKYGGSRFDFYMETDRDKIYMEVKGVTLEENGILRFPDAPSERAVKHMEELIRAVGEGFSCYVLFVIQMKGARCFAPNRDTHPRFAEALQRAAAAGVHVLAYDCLVSPDRMELADPVPVELCPDPLTEMVNPLLAWYRSGHRPLPWREAPTPYRVWVSEIMLQQTRVEAVKPYYRRFMEALPDIESLAEVPEQTLLKLWEGLGYYSRARNLQAAARQIMEEFGGEMPSSYGELLTLKGIGSYTAGGIASIAFGRRVPAVDGNVLRVVSRLRADPDFISDPKVKKRVEGELEEIMPRDCPGDFNQAMMELGAVVCIPSGRPRCGECPLSRCCRAHARGCESDYPRKAPRKGRTVEEKTVLVIRDGNRAALRRRPPRGLLAGMYEFPSLPGLCTVREVKEYLEENGLRPLRIQPLPESRHIFTHREWHMCGYLVRVDELSPRIPRGESASWLFVEPRQAQKDFPLPSALAAYAPYLSIRLGKENFDIKQQ